jgi:hypothetical protein
MREELYQILANHTGKTFEEIERDSDRDYWLRAQEAKEYGLIDEVLVKKKKMAQVTCSFCGRNKKDVDLMVSGISAHICNFCIDQAHQILGEEDKNQEIWN